MKHVMIKMKHNNKEYVIKYSYFASHRKWITWVNDKEIFIGQHPLMFYNKTNKEPAKAICDVINKTSPSRWKYMDWDVNMKREIQKLEKEVKILEYSIE